MRLPKLLLELLLQPLLTAGSLGQSPLRATISAPIPSPGLGAACVQTQKIKSFCQGMAPGWESSWGARGEQQPCPAVHTYH